MLQLKGDSQKGTPQELLPELLPELLLAERIAEHSQGKLLQGRGMACGISTDSRTLVDGELFVALPGENFDGHDHLPEATRRGASGFLLSRVPRIPLPLDCFVILVRDTRRALCALAAAYRRRLSMKVVAITGSCGKTSSKEIVRRILEGQFSIVAAHRSFNNEIGVPLTLFRCTQRTELCVLELGSNNPGEIQTLGKIALPDIALITMVGRSHLAGLASIEGVLHEKASLLDQLRPGGVAILNADSPYFEFLRRRALADAGAGRRVLSFGFSEGADFRASTLRPVGCHGLSFALSYPGTGYPGTDYLSAGNSNETPGPDRATANVSLSLPGRHNVKNSLCALAIAYALGQDPSGLIAALASLPFVPRRLEAKQARSGAILLDDSYNANPDSLMAGLAVLDAWSAVRRRFLVLGDMLELGPQGREIHRDLAASLFGRVDQVLTLGALAEETGKAFAAKKPGTHQSFADANEAMAAVQSMFREGDLVLFKASRRIGLDRVVDALL